MSRGTMICMLATLLALSVVCSAQAPRVIAQRLCDQVDQAFANQDVNQVLGFLDPSYVGTDAQGHRTAFPEVRKQLEHNFTVLRRMHPKTTVEDVQWEAGRMIINYRNEMRYEFHARQGWAVMLYTATGRTTWEKKDGEWKIVRDITQHDHVQVDPEWQQFFDDTLRCWGNAPGEKGCPKNR